MFVEKACSTHCAPASDTALWRAQAILSGLAVLPSCTRRAPDDRSLNCWLIVIKEIPGMRNLADCTADMGSFLSAAASFYNVMDRVAVLLDI